MPTSGNGDFPFRSAWFWRRDLLAGAHLLRSKIRYGDDDPAARDLWLDWLFGAAVVVVPPIPAPELGLDLQIGDDSEPDLALAWFAAAGVLIDEPPPYAELALELFGGDGEFAGGEFALSDEPILPADAIALGEFGEDFADDLHDLLDFAIAGVADDLLAVAGADDWLTRSRRRMRR